jgi:hypothetical protein
MYYIIQLIILLGVLLFLFFLLYFFYNRMSRRYRQTLRGPKNAELVRVLLNLEKEPLEQLFSLYKQQFGEGPARYARQTYQKWKTGEVRPNKQTFARFLINLPKVMSFDLKCEVLRELREAYLDRDHYELSVHTNDWKEKLRPLVESIIAKGDAAELPEALHQKLSWLAENDAQVANELIERSQRQQSLSAMAMLDEEFSNIETLLDNAGRRSKVTHILKLPYGTIALKIKRS